jgi:hypothetical protein
MSDRILGHDTSDNQSHLHKRSMVMSILVTMLLAQYAAGAECKPDVEGWCTNPSVEYAIKEGQSTVRIQVSVKVGSVVVVKLPAGEMLADDHPPVQGNGAYLNVVLTKPKEKTDSIVMILNPFIAPATERIINQGLAKTNIQVRLSSDTIINLNVRVTTKPGVETLTFHNPAHEQKINQCRNLLAKEREDIMQELDKKRQNLDGTLQTMLRDYNTQAHNKRVSCRFMREKAKRDYLVLWVYSLCHIGDDLYITFEIENRKRSLFVLDTIEFFADGQETAMDAHVGWNENREPKLQYDQTIKATAMIPISEDTSSASYRIRVTESAGSKRVVELRELGF